MKMFNDRFHTVLRTPVPPNTVTLKDTQFAYTQPQCVTSALQYQNAVMKEMNVKHTETIIDQHQVIQMRDNEQAVLHNLQLATSSCCKWITLDDALHGPSHVAKLLIDKCQTKRSVPGKPYRLNAEQVECIAVYVAASCIGQRFRKTARSCQTFDKSSRNPHDYYHRWRRRLRQNDSRR